MKKCVLLVLFTWMFVITPALAADVGFNLNLQVGNRPAAVPAYVAPPLIVAEPPEFVMPSALGFYVAVGVPFDMVIISNSYYVHKGNSWYLAPGYNGPWVAVSHGKLPPGLRKHRFERIRYFRDMEYRRFRADGGHYRGKHFRPEKDRKEQRKSEHAQWQGERKSRKGDRHGD